MRRIVLWRRFGDSLSAPFLRAVPIRSRGYSSWDEAEQAASKRKQQRQSQSPVWHEASADTKQSKPKIRRVKDVKDKMTLVSVPTSRLDQLLEAEITVLSLRAATPMTLQKILDLKKADVWKLAEVLHEELPVRYAQRIRMLEDLPDWYRKVSIASVREMYLASFKELRLADPQQQHEFQDLLWNMKERHSQTNRLVEGFRAYAEEGELDAAQVDDWLDKFFLLRVSTNMLMSHYLLLSGSQFSSLSPPETQRMSSGIDLEYNPYRSSIDPKCSVSKISHHAAHLVSEMSRAQYGVAPVIHVVDNGSEEFPFVPRYFLYIVSELLKNSVRATIETHLGVMHKPFCAADAERLPPITVLVSGNGEACCCRVSDEGGGIPLDLQSHVWSYLFSTAEALTKTVTRAAVDAPEDLRRISAMQSQEDQVQMKLMTQFRSPLAGTGCGLPLCRLYSEYLGGSIELQTMPRYGTDVFVYLHSLGDSCETFLPHH